MASGSLTTCSNPLLFIGNLFPGDTKVQGHSTTGSVGLGVSDKIRATTDDLTCKHSSWALNHVSGFSGQGMQSDSHTLPRAFFLVTSEFNTLHFCSGSRIRPSSVLESDLMVLTVALFC